MEAKEDHERPEASGCSPPSKRQKVTDDRERVVQLDERKKKYPEILPNSKTNLKTENVLRIMIQAVEEMGLDESASTLRRETCVSEESLEISQLKKNILGGDWESVLSMIPNLQTKSSIHRLVLYWNIHRHRYLEAIESDDLSLAMNLLREKLVSLSVSIDSHKESIDDVDYLGSIKTLSSLLILNHPDSMKSLANWYGIQNGARNRLIESLHNYLSPTIILPPGRLGELLDQAVISQHQGCFYYHKNGDCDNNLLENHHCNPSKIPNKPKILQPEHEDEVWCLAFSHSGKYLASGSKDSSIFLWTVMNEEKGKFYKKLPVGGIGGIQQICWSSDDKFILCSTVNQVILCGIENDNVIKMFDTSIPKSNIIQSVLWSKDEKSFICAGLGQFITKYSLSGEEQYTWHVSNVVDIAYNSNSNILVGVCQQQKINIINLYDNSIESIQEISRISSVEISEDGNYILVHLCSQVIHLWDFKTKKLVYQYYHKRSLESINVFLTATFGVQDSFILSGSIDGKIYLWQRDGTLLEIIKEHTKSVNCIKWNKSKHVESPMFASCGDDNKVILWEC